MQSKPLEFPLAVARDFVRDLMAFHAKENTIKRDETVARQLHSLAKFRGPRDKKLRRRANAGLISPIMRAVRAAERGMLEDNGTAKSHGSGKCVRGYTFTSASGRIARVGYHHYRPHLRLLSVTESVARSRLTHEECTTCRNPLA
jgi:hypothetical protein